MPRGLSFVFLFQSIRANTVVGRVQVGTREGMAFDGAYIWVANEKGPFREQNRSHRQHPGRESGGGIENREASGRGI